MKYLYVTLFFLFPLFLYSNIKVPSLISDGMVLQRDENISIWGWADPHETIRIEFRDRFYASRADECGNWRTLIPAGKAGGPYEISIFGNKDSLVIEDVLVGDVYLCSGQSNMAFKMERIKDKYTEDIENSTNNQIRQFLVKPSWSYSKKNDMESGDWKVVNPQNILDFSAVGYFFAKELYDKFRIPIGIINASYSATVAEGWVSREGLREFANFIEKADEYAVPDKIDRIIQAQNTAKNDWYNSLEKHEQLRGNYDWVKDNNILNDWKTVQVPGFWSSEELKNFTGSVWLKRTINIENSELLNQSCKLYTGAIDDRFTVYVNGSKIGSEWQRAKDRNFKIPDKILRKGSNIITLRIVNPEGPAGFYLDRTYKMKFDTAEIDLTGNWKYKIGVKMPELSSKKNVKFNLIPTFLFNSMIFPLTTYKIKAVVWYQGEGNASRGKEYRLLFQSLINDWRYQWKMKNLPFLFVQLANYGNPKSYNTSWAELREAQSMALKLPNTGMAVTYDIGESYNIHPNNKKEVGRRLSLKARDIIYDEEIISSGPVYKQKNVVNDKIILDFDHIGSGLVAKSFNGTLKGFFIADSTRRFLPANASIYMNKIVVSNKEIERPIAVRYAWINNPIDANLYNKEGLPADPFRTDCWDDYTYF